MQSHDLERVVVVFLASQTTTDIEKMFSEAGGINKIKSNYNMGPNFRGFSAVMDAR